MTRAPALLALAGAVCGSLSSACDRLSGSALGADRDTVHALELATRHGCASCHEIPGATITGRVGPSLRGVGERAYLAGSLPNTPEQMVAWIRFPDREQPGTLMPNVRVTEADARALAAYLYTLR